MPANFLSYFLEQIKKMEAEKLLKIIADHKLWLEGKEGGKRADLRSANLSYADLRSANLSYADLRSANLSSANLSYADLRSADLRSANLSSANLSYADLRSANLSSADLRSANLSSANLRYADLSYADLRSANLKEIKKDFFKRLLIAKNEAAGLYDALQKGKVNGSCYEGECACFVGTIANIRKEHYTALKIDLRPQVSSPTERWFFGINQGDIPQTNQVSKIVTEWIEEFAKENSIGLPSYKIVSSTEAPQAFGKELQSI